MQGGETRIRCSVHSVPLILLPKHGCKDGNDLGLTRAMLKRQAEFQDVIENKVPAKKETKETQRGDESQNKTNPKFKDKQSQSEYL
jgi:hypothetical protein